MYSISALGKDVTPAETKAEERGYVKVVFPIPKSEANLESSYVFVGGSKDVDDRATPREEGSVSPVK